MSRACNESRAERVGVDGGCWSADAGNLFVGVAGRDWFADEDAAEGLVEIRDEAEVMLAQIIPIDVSNAQDWFAEVGVDAVFDGAGWTASEEPMRAARARARMVAEGAGRVTFVETEAGSGVAASVARMVAS